MKTKIKEAVSVFIAIAFISIAAGGDYYYSEMHRLRCHRPSTQNTNKAGKSSATSHEKVVSNTRLARFL